METDCRGYTVHDVPHVQGGQHIEARQVRDRPGVVQSCAEGDQRTAVVADQGKLLVSQSISDLDGVCCHGSLCIGVGIAFGGFVAVTVTTQIRADDGVVGREVSRDVPPHQVGLWKSVQQDDGAA